MRSPDVGCEWSCEVQSFLRDRKTGQRSCGRTWSSGLRVRPGSGVPGGDGRDGRGGGRVGPPPAQPSVQRQGGEREQAGGCADAAQGAIALQGAAGILPPRRRWRRPAVSGRPARHLRRSGPGSRYRAGTRRRARRRLAGLVLNAVLGWWWADPAAGYVLVFYAAREVRDIFFTGH